RPPGPRRPGGFRPGVVTPPAGLPPRVFRRLAPLLRSGGAPSPPMPRPRRSDSGRPSAAPDPTDSPRLSVGVESRRRLGRASVWSVATYGGVQALRFVGNVVLWRLLFEEAFGIMALVNALLMALQMFSDIGIGPSIVQNQRGAEASFLNTAWTLQVV